MATKKTQKKEATPQDLGAAMYKITEAFSTFANEITEGYEKAMHLTKLKVWLKNTFNLDFNDEQVETIDKFMEASHSKTVDFLEAMADYIQKETHTSIGFEEMEDEDNSEKVEDTFNECSICGRSFEEEKITTDTIGKSAFIKVAPSVEELENAEAFPVNAVEITMSMQRPEMELPKVEGHDENIKPLGIVNFPEPRMSGLEILMQAFKIVLAIVIVLLLVALNLK